MASMSEMLLALLLFSGVIIGFSSYAGNLAVSSGSSVPAISENFSYISRIMNETQNIESNLRSAQVTNTVLDLPAIVVVGVYSVLRLVYITLSDLYVGFIGGVAEFLFLPSWAISLATAALLISIIFSFVKAILKWDV